MRFEMGSRVKWKDACPIRLGYMPSDIGQVVALSDDPTGSGEIDIAFENGDVVHGAFAHWFEPAERETGERNESALAALPAQAAERADAIKLGQNAVAA